LDTTTPLAHLTNHFSGPESQSSLRWSKRNDGFADWVVANMRSVVQKHANEQATEFEMVRLRAGLTRGVTRKVGELAPHLIMLVGLAAFVYMCGIVHIH
jgi:hypothetical protein